MSKKNPNNLKTIDARPECDQCSEKFRWNEVGVYIYDPEWFSKRLICSDCFKERLGLK